MKRRTCAALFGLATIASMPAWAAFPDKPIRILVGFPPGSTGDVIARALAGRLGDGLGQAVIVENRTGAGSSIAAEAVARAPADGYTLLLSTTANVINQSVSRTLKFDFARDLAPVMLIAENPVVLVVPASSPYRTVAALIAAAKKSPDQLTFASSGNGTFTHLYGELFNQSAAIRLRHIPYRGSTPAMTDVMAGQVDVSFTPVTPVLGQIRGGKLRALAVVGKSRVAALPDVPTLGQAGIAGFDLPLWFGLHAPAGTPAAAIERLSAQLARTLREADVAGPLAAQSVLVVGKGAADFAAQVDREMDQWSRVAKSADIKED